jgi:hypothetical protein
MAARKFDQNRLDQLVEAAKASERPYAALEGKPFNLSASVARTLVVGSGLSKSAPKVVEREKTRIAKWLEQGSIGPAKATPKAAKPKAVQVPESAPDNSGGSGRGDRVPKAVAEAVTEHAQKATRTRGQRKDGQASALAQEIAVGHAKPVTSSA